MIYCPVCGRTDKERHRPSCVSGWAGREVRADDLPPDPRRARVTDRGTSHAAASSAKVGPIREGVLRLMLEHGELTDEALVNWHMRASGLGHVKRASPSGVRSRRAELTAEGYIADTGRVDRLTTLRTATVWRLTDKGRQLAETLVEARG